MEKRRKDKRENRIKTENKRREEEKTVLIEQNMRK